MKLTPTQRRSRPTPSARAPRAAAVAPAASARARSAGTAAPAAAQRPRLDDIGYWPALSLDIVREYATAFSRIVGRQPGLTHYYVEAFAPGGVGRPGDQLAPGNPLNGLLVTPPFRHHYLVALGGARVGALAPAVAKRIDVTLCDGDGNQVLREEILPRVRSEDYRRALCVLGPCGLDLDWDVVEKAGRLRTIDLFLSLPVADAAGSALWASDHRFAAAQRERMKRFWGDESWREATDPAITRDRAARGPAPGGPAGAAVARAFRNRLGDVAGFANVPEPLPLRNRDGAVVHYLFFGARNGVANEVVEGLFARYRRDEPEA